MLLNSKGEQDVARSRWHEKHPAGDYWEGVHAKAFNSDAEVIAYVTKTRGAIGYVSASAGTEGVKVLDLLLKAEAVSED